MVVAKVVATVQRCGTACGNYASVRAGSPVECVFIDERSWLHLIVKKDVTPGHCGTVEILSPSIPRVFSPLVHLHNNARGFGDHAST